MAELEVLDIAATWSFWDREIPASVPRRVELPETITDSVCLAIQGVRRCGKSTLMQQLVGRYGLDPRVAHSSTTKGVRKRDAPRPRGGTSTNIGTKPSGRPESADPGGRAEPRTWPSHSQLL